MNNNFGSPVSRKSDISCRITLPVPSTIHVILHSLYIPKTTSRYCFLIHPLKPDGVYVRIYWCVRCPACSKLNFLDCTNGSCGKWTFHKFISKKKNGLKNRSQDKRKRKEKNAGKGKGLARKRKKIKVPNRASEKESYGKILGLSVKPNDP